MFKVNLYTEREEKRRRARRQAMTTAAISGVLGINAVLVGSLILGATLLQERCRTLGDEVARLQTLAEHKGAKSPGLDLTRELFQLRQERVEWSPLLASIAENIPSSLLLEDIQGQTAHGRVQKSFDMNGMGRGGTVAMADVSGFVNRLRDDPRVNKVFPDVALGSVRSESGEFQVVCETPIGK